VLLEVAFISVGLEVIFFLPGYDAPFLISAVAPSMPATAPMIIPPIRKTIPGYPASTGTTGFAYASKRPWIWLLIRFSSKVLSFVFLSTFRSRLSTAFEV
jgi:hypothetical protein